MRNEPFPFYLGNQPIYLLPEKAMFIPEKRTLIIADVHFGKAEHFRKAGIFMPPNAGTLEDYKRLAHLIDKYQPLQIMFLGDLFHSTENSSWLHFLSFAKQHSTTQLILIKGNHDILPSKLYLDANLIVYPEHLEEDIFIFSHGPLTQVPPGKINVAGHIHPGTTLVGLGKQKLTLPCFHYEHPLLLLPAFGSLTGVYKIPRSHAKQFVVTSQKIIEV